MEQLFKNPSSIETQSIAQTAGRAHRLALQYRNSPYGEPEPPPGRPERPAVFRGRVTGAGLTEVAHRAEVTAHWMKVELQAWDARPRLNHGATSPRLERCHKATLRQEFS